MANSGNTYVSSGVEVAALCPNSDVSTETPSNAYVASADIPSKQKTCMFCLKEYSKANIAWHIKTCKLKPYVKVDVESTTSLKIKETNVACYICKKEIMSSNISKH